MISFSAPIFASILYKFLFCVSTAYLMSAHKKNNYNCAVFFYNQNLTAKSNPTLIKCINSILLHFLAYVINDISTRNYSLFLLTTTIVKYIGFYTIKDFFSHMSCSLTIVYPELLFAENDCLREAAVSRSLKIMKKICYKFRGKEKGIHESQQKRFPKDFRRCNGGNRSGHQP